MRKVSTFLVFVSITLAALALAGCAAVDRQAVQAQAGAPTPAQVEILSVPYDAACPRFVVAVMPFEYGASGVVSGGPSAAPAVDPSLLAPLTGALAAGQAVDSAHPGIIVSPVGRGVSAQLVSALARCGNISILDCAALTRKDDGTYACKMNPGEVGPFVIKGVVTEFNETADLSQKTRGGSLGMLGAALGVAGAASGHSGLGWTGAGIAAANPTYQNMKLRRKGMVGMDLQLVDGRTARLAGGYNCAGTFMTQSATSGLSVFSIGGGNSEFAASALGQATRAAMNDALKKTFDALKSAPR